VAERVYSERFVWSAVAGVWESWTCPAGYRAIVTSIMVVCRNDAGGLCMVSIGPVVAWQRTYPVGGGNDSVTTRAVFYPGESCQCYVGSGDMWVALCGYLFSDDSERSQQLPVVPDGPRPEP
jgi:hypothetical protein